MQIMTWLRAVRAPFFAVTATPVGLGTAIAYQEVGTFDPAGFVFALAGVLLIGMGTNLANDYFDHTSGADEANPTPTPFSGGSRVIQEGVLSASTVLAAAVASFVAAAVIGLYLVSRHGNVVLLLGAVGAFFGIFYTASPLRLGYRGIGEPLVGVGVGTLVMAGAYYVQAGRVSAELWLASVPITLLVALLLLINEVPDYSSDRAIGKITLVVMIGQRGAVGVYRGGLVFTYLWVFVMAALRTMTPFALVTLATLPLALRAFRGSGRYRGEASDLLPAAAATFVLDVLFGLLLTSAYVADAFL